MQMTDPIDLHSFGFRLAYVARRLRQAVDGELWAFGLTEATWRPLAYVGHLGEGVRQKELAEALGIQGPSLVRLLDALERRGMIERREQESDRRVRGIYLTQAGRRLQQRIARSSSNIQCAYWEVFARLILRPAHVCSTKSSTRLISLRSW